MIAPAPHHPDVGVPSRDELLTQHLGLVHHVARQLAARGHDAIEFDELVSAGTMGLIQALSSFDAARGHSFSTFAVPRIRGAILDELRRMDHVPRSVRRKARDLARARAEMEAELGRAPTTAEVARRVGITEEVLRHWERDLESDLQMSLDQATQDDGGRAPVQVELLAESGLPTIEERLTLEQESLRLHAAMQELKPQERNVLALYYFEELKLQEIGEVLGLSACRISQIRTAALAKLRGRLARLRAA